MLRAVGVLLLVLAGTGCTKVGPDFTPPEAPVAQAWRGAEDPQLTAEGAPEAAWWQAFDDPELTSLIDLARQQNPNVQLAGVRVLQAQAQLGAAIGDLYPQQQALFAELTYERLSDSDSRRGILNLDDNDFGALKFGAGASWEIDFWGKFRRAIEAADATLQSSVADYEDALVSLAAEVASNYVDLLTYQERLRIARENTETQKESLNLADVRYRNGETSETDVAQATAEYAQTRSEIPQLEIGVRQSRHALAVLLGVPPSDLGDLVAADGEIPVAPPEVAIGIPAELLRRRPDVRSAELQAAAQSAMIGAKQADLYPAFSLSGTFGFLSTTLGESDLLDAFDWSSRVVSFGPSVVWNVFNYGQITNQVRAQDAAFQQAVLSYQNTVLEAQQEVEDALASFLGSQQSLALLQEAVKAGRLSLRLATVEYREGATDYTTVLVAQQNLLEQEDQLAQTEGSIAQALISLYRALGGGWQPFQGDLVRADIEDEMARRTDWGGLLKEAPSDLDAEATVPPPVF